MARRARIEVLNTILVSFTIMGGDLLWFRLGEENNLRTSLSNNFPSTRSIEASEVFVLVVAVTVEEPLGAGVTPDGRLTYLVQAPTTLALNVAAALEFAVARYGDQELAASSKIPGT